MSEQARLNLLKKRLDKLINKRKIWTGVAVCGATVGVGIFQEDALMGGPFHFDVLTLLTGIAVSAICGTAAIWHIQNHYEKQENAIVRQIEQIEQMAPVIPKCGKCGKEIPQGDAYFCPFCGNSLEASTK